MVENIADDVAMITGLRYAKGQDAAKPLNDEDKERMKRTLFEFLRLSKTRGRS